MQKNKESKYKNQSKIKNHYQITITSMMSRKVVQIPWLSTSTIVPWLRLSLSRVSFKAWACFMGGTAGTSTCTQMQNLIHWTFVFAFSWLLFSEFWDNILLPLDKFRSKPVEARLLLCFTINLIRSSWEKIACGRRHVCQRLWFGCHQRILLCFQK